MAVGRNDNYDLKKKGTVIWHDCTFFFSGCFLVWRAMFFDWTFFYSGPNLEAAKIWRERYDLKKKRTVVFPAMFFDWTFFSSHNLEAAQIWWERYVLKKKTYSHLDNYVFRLDLFFQVVIRGGSDLAETLRPEKKRSSQKT